MMRCTQCQDLMDDYIRGSLTDSLNKKMADHIADCNYCTKEFESLKSLTSLLKQEPEMTVSEYELADFLPGVWQKIEGERKISLRNLIFKLVPALAVAMILAFIIIKPSVDITVYQAESLIEEEIYTESGYFAFINLIFANEDPVVLDLIESELYQGSYSLFRDNYDEYLENLSDEDLKHFEEELNILLITKG